MRRGAITAFIGLALAAGAASCGDDERGGVEVQGGTTGTTGTATTGTTGTTAPRTVPETAPRTTPTTP